MAGKSRARGGLEAGRADLRRCGSRAGRGAGLGAGPERSGAGRWAGCRHFSPGSAGRPRVLRANEQVGEHQGASYAPRARV